MTLLPSRRPGFPERIVCMTEETTETLYLLGEDWRIVGISGFTVRPPQARREKPKVSTFTSADIGAIAALKPDLVLGFSDLQAGIAADLIRAGLELHIFNHRSVPEILRTIRIIGGLVGAHERADALVAELEAGLDKIRESAALLERHPRVYFEEWDEPQISGIRWVSELVEIAGGIECFPELRSASLARDRFITDPLEVPRRNPDLIIGSWCGKEFKPDRVRRRPGWQDVPAIRDGELHEVRSALILQPGPAALTDGVRALHAIISGWATRQGVKARARAGGAEGA